jgi:hypothetical protein
MDTYFIGVQVTPLPDNPLIEKVESARVFFWIVDTSPENAMNRATQHLAEYLWKLETVEKEPMVVTAADFADHEQGLKGWWGAKQKGFAAQFMAKPRPGHTDSLKPES